MNMEKQFKLALTEREAKIIDYCYNKINKKFNYKIQDCNLYLSNCPELAIDEIINTLTEVYFLDKKNNIKSFEAINELVEKLFTISNNYVESYDFNEYLDNNNKDKKD